MVTHRCARRTGRIVVPRRQAIPPTLHQQKLVRWQHPSLLPLTLAVLAALPAENQLNFFGETTDWTWVGLVILLLNYCLLHEYLLQWELKAAIIGISSTRLVNQYGSQPAAIFLQEVRVGWRSAAGKRFHLQTPKLAVRECS